MYPLLFAEYTLHNCRPILFYDYIHLHCTNQIMCALLLNFIPYCMYYNDFSFVRYIYSENMLLTILETGMIVDEILPIENNLQFVSRA